MNSMRVLVVDDEQLAREELCYQLDQPMSSGIGLSNVRERLRVIYGTTYQLKLSSEPGKGTLARIEVPELSFAHEQLA